MAIHNMKLSRGRRENQFLIYTLLEFLAADKVLVKNHKRDEWDPKYCLSGDMFDGTTIGISEQEWKNSEHQYPRCHNHVSSG